MIFIQPTSKWTKLCLAFVASASLVACHGDNDSSGESPATTTIVTQPQSTKVADGQPATFTVAVTGGSSSTLQWSRDGQPIAGATNASYTLAAAQLADSGASFSVTVSSAGSNVRSDSANLTVTPVAPHIASDSAQTVSVMSGATASFAVVSSGSAPLSFQWRRSGMPISGATSATYTTLASAPSDDGSVYDVTVANSAGAVTSAPFTLRVVVVPQPAAITVQPRSTSVHVAADATLSVVANGTAPLSYQWYRGGVAIAGAQSSSYTIGATMTGDDQALFTVVVKGPVNTVTSDVAILTVLPSAGLALVAGNIGGQGFVEGPGATSRLTFPRAAAVDASGAVYFIDASTIRKLDVDGNVSLIAGSPLESATVDGPVASARFNNPQAIAIDPFGNLFVCGETFADVIRKVTPTGVVSTVAGSVGTSGFADGVGPAASFSSPQGLAADKRGNVFVTDTSNHIIRKVTPAGVVTTFAGTPSLYGAAGYADGLGPAARFSSPNRIAIDVDDVLYVSDSVNYVVRKITPDRNVTTLAGNPGNAGSVDGTAASARFRGLNGIAVDATKNVYVTEALMGSTDVRKITPSGVVTRLLGVADDSYSPGDYVDGAGPIARFMNPIGLASDASGVLYVPDLYGFALRRVSTANVVSTVAGAPAIQGAVDANGAAATFYRPSGLAMDGAGVLYVADGDSIVRKVSRKGDVTTLAGSARQSGYSDGVGAAARFASPSGVGVDATGNLYVTDQFNAVIRTVTSGGTVTTLAGKPGPTQGPPADGLGRAANFSYPMSVAVAPSGTAYISERTAGSIRAVSRAGLVTTLVRSSTSGGPGPASPLIQTPQQVAVDATGNVIVVDSVTSAVLKVVPTGEVTVVAGQAGTIGAIDGPAASARFNAPTGVAIDASGNIFVADNGNRTIRRIDVSGNVTTVAGVADGVGGVKVGAFPGHFTAPQALAIDGRGVLYVTDANGIVRITPP